MKLAFSILIATFGFALVASVDAATQSEKEAHTAGRCVGIYDAAFLVNKQLPPMPAHTDVYYSSNGREFTISRNARNVAFEAYKNNPNSVKIYFEKCLQLPL